MSAPGAVNPPPARGGNKITGFIKRNKLLVSAAGLGGGILLLSKSGSGGGGDGQIIDSEGNDSTVSDGPVQLVPVSAPPNEGSDDNTVEPNDPTPLPEDQDTTSPSPKPPPNTTIIINVPKETTGAPPPKNPADGHSSGVTIHGRFFPGANSHRIVGTRNGSHGGQYQIHLLGFPGRNEYWWYYTKGQMAGRWTGPHHAPGGGPAKPTTTKPHTTKPKGTLYAGHPLSYWQDPKHSRKNGKWQWPNEPGHFNHTKAFKA